MNTNHTIKIGSYSQSRGNKFFMGGTQSDIVLGLFLWLTFVVSYGQKIAHKTIIDPETTNIHINTANVYQLQLTTGDTKEINVEALIDGEYSTEQVVQLTKNGGTAMISVEFQPNFEVPNDKLSAHKVLSVALKIEVPQGKSIYVYGTGSNVSAAGIYNHLKIVLDTGKCSLHHVQASVAVQTQSGDITLQGVNVAVEAFSTYGAVFGAANATGNHLHQLSTVTGNIYLNKTE